jgi:hypothetical protein
MSTDVTMQDLELEHAELLPSRETLWCGGSSHSGVSNSFNNQFAFLSGNNVASGDSIALINLGGQSSSATAIGNLLG